MSHSKIPGGSWDSGRGKEKGGVGTAGPGVGEYEESQGEYESRNKGIKIGDSSRVRREFLGGRSVHVPVAQLGLVSSSTRINVGGLDNLISETCDMR